MTVIDGKEGAPRPIFNLLELGFDNVENDRDAILIIVSDDSLMRVGRVTTHDAILLAGELSWVVRLHEPLYLLLLHFHVFLLLLDSHNETAVGCQLVLALRLLHSRSAGRAILLCLWLLNPGVRCRRLGMASVLVSLAGRHG